MSDQGALPVSSQPEAQAVCEHFYASHCYRGMEIRLCMPCHEPDWDDLERQLREAAGDIALARLGPEPPPAVTGPSVPVSGKSPGQRLHEARQAGGARRPRPWPVEDWEDRDEQLRALDEEMAEAASVPERERAERAEAKLAALRKHAAEWAARAPADDWGLTPADTVTADCGRAILAIIGSEEEARDA